LFIYQKHYNDKSTLYHPGGVLSGINLIDQIYVIIRRIAMNKAERAVCFVRYIFFPGMVREADMPPSTGRTWPVI
jgi:hypothetical protein